MDKFLWRASRKVFGGFLSKLFYQQRVDTNGEVIPPKKFLTVFNQRLVENGFVPPWVMTKDECQDFWASISNKEEYAGNRPDEYARKDKGIIEFLHNFWSPPVSCSDSIMELGCNCGGNLNGLLQRGYSNLAGVEINKNAIAEMSGTFTRLSQTARIYNGSLENVLLKMPSKSVDLIFTMAVLIHIHPSSNFIFKEIARIAKEHICVFELEEASCGYVFPRNYKRVFTNRHCALLKTVKITRQRYPHLPRVYDGYVARLFKVR